MYEVCRSDGLMCVMIYIPSFIKIDSGIQKLIRGHAQTRKQAGNLISLVSLIFPNMESRLKRDDSNA
jgi:hypothetical protein